MIRMQSLLLAALLGVLVAGCGVLKNSGDRLTIDDIVEDIRSRGVSLVEVDRAMHEFFSVSGHAFAVEGGGEIHIYEYRSEASATLDASKIEAKRSTDPPHFYQRENIIAVYTGRDLTVEAALTDVLGSQLG